MEKYTDIKPAVIEGWPDAHHVFLQVTNQRFCVSPHGCETKEEAEWMRDQLCVALTKVAEDAINERLADLRAERRGNEVC